MIYGSQPNLPQWRPYPHDPRYLVCSDGFVKSLITGKVLKPRKLPSGYLRVSLGGVKDQYIHTMVLETFFGPRPKGHQVSHLNGDRANNFILNLQWMTPADNNGLKKYHGTSTVGARNGMGKKTHCKRGHEFTPANTRSSNGKRVCRACAREHSAKNRGRT